MTASAIDSEQVTAWATVGLGFATLLVALFAMWQVRITRAALRAADRDAAEATKARIDQRSPSVVVMVAAEARPTAGWLVELAPGTRFDGREHGGVALAITAWFDIYNEGKTTAVVRLPDGVLVLPRDSSVSSLNALTRTARPDGRMLRLRPGDGNRLLVEIRKPLMEWVKAGASPTVDQRLVLLSEDTFAEGVRDAIGLVLRGTPIIPGNRQDEWVGAPPRMRRRG